MLIRNLRMIGIVCSLLLLSSCVKTTNQRLVDPESAHDKRVELGMQYLGIDKRDNARRQFSKALEYKKNSAEAWHGIGLVHEANGETEPAGKAFQRALRLADKRNRTPIAVSYGKYLMSQQEADKACPYFEEAGADFDYPQRSEALYFLGKCAAITGDVGRVKSAYEHALNLNDRYTAPMIDLAEIYFNEGEYSRSKRMLDRFLALSTPTAQSLWLSIRIERVFGNRDREASSAMALRNLFPYSKEYLEYKQLNQQ